MSTQTAVDQVQFTLGRDELMMALKDVLGALPTKPVIPIHQCILIQVGLDNLRLTATNTDIIIETMVSATVKAQGVVAIPGRKLMEIASKLPSEPISFTVEGENVAISCKRSKFNLTSLPAEDFPRTDWDGFDKQTIMPSNAFQDVLRMTAFAAANWDNGALSGVQLVAKDGLFESIATDGSRMAYKFCAIDKKYALKALVPQKTCSELIKLLDSKDKESTVSIGTDGKGGLLIKSESRRMLSRQVSGEYPEYKKLFPEESSTVVTVNTEAMLRGLERAALLTDERTHLVKVKYDSDTLHITANTPDLGKVHEEVEITLEGKTLEMAFNIRFVIELLSRIPQETVNIEMTGALKPIIFVAGDDYKHLVMPVQAK